MPDPLPGSFSYYYMEIPLLKFCYQSTKAGINIKVHTNKTLRFSLSSQFCLAEVQNLKVEWKFPQAIAVLLKYTSPHSYSLDVNFGETFYNKLR